MAFVSKAQSCGPLHKNMQPTFHASRNQHPSRSAFAEVIVAKGEMKREKFTRDNLSPKFLCPTYLTEPCLPYKYVIPIFMSAGEIPFTCAGLPARVKYMSLNCRKGEKDCSEDVSEVIAACAEVNAFRATFTSTLLASHLDISSLRILHFL